jgi:hypothetical protein
MRDTTPDPRSTPLPPSLLVGATRWAADESTEEHPDAAAVPSRELVRLLTDLRAKLAEHVAGRRAAGASPERIIGEVRCLVREAESYEGWRDPSDALMSHAVRWSIEAYYGSYYDAPALRYVPSFY